MPAMRGTEQASRKVTPHLAVFWAFVAKPVNTAGTAPVSPLQHQPQSCCVSSHVFAKIKNPLAGITIAEECGRPCIDGPFALI